MLPVLRVSPFVGCRADTHAAARRSIDRPLSAPTCGSGELVAGVSFAADGRNCGRQSNARLATKRWCPFHYANVSLAVQIARFGIAYTHRAHGDTKILSIRNEKRVQGSRIDGNECK